MAVLFAVSVAFALSPETVQAQRSNFHVTPGASHMQRGPAPMAGQRNTAQLGGEFRTALRPHGQWHPMGAQGGEGALAQA